MVRVDTASVGPGQSWGGDNRVPMFSGAGLGGKSWPTWGRQHGEDGGFREQGAFCEVPGGSGAQRAQDSDTPVSSVKPVLSQQRAEDRMPLGAPVLSGAEAS